MKYLYHGTTADILDIFIHGLLAREDREGISVTTKPERAEFWGGLKRGPVEILRIPSDAVTTMIPENAFPADPRYDFTVDTLISPAFIEVKIGKAWLPMIQAYGHLLEDEELAEWKEKWMSKR